MNLNKLSKGMLLILRYMLIDKKELVSDTYSRRQYWIQGEGITTNVTARNISNISAKALCNSDIIQIKQNSSLRYSYSVKPQYVEPILEILKKTEK